MGNDFVEDYTIVDIETTGLSPVNNEIIELSAIKIRGNKVVEKFSSLVKPRGAINSFITGLTGITNDMVKDAPSITTVLEEFLKFVSDDCVMGHNVSFDMRFIRHNLQKYLNNDFENPSIDTVKVARRFCPKLPSYKLSNLAKHFDIDTEGHHRALKDCEMTFDIYNKIQESAKV